MIDPAHSDWTEKKHELTAHVENPHDAGTRARMKLNMRIAARKAARFTERLVLLTLFLSYAAALGIVYYGYTTRVTGTYVDHRECKLPLNEDYAITGKRTYTYPYVEVFGVRVVQTEQIDEVTQIDLRGQSIVTVGQTKDNWWAINNEQGERGVQILKPADTYTFVMDGDRIGVIAYKSFCR